MNEQRLQEYYRLIQELLSCADGEEAGILQANAELLDAEFLQVVVAVAGEFTEEGQENIANWLLGLASRLSEELNLPLEVDTQEEATPISEEDLESYLRFLLEILQATAESEGDAQVVYPLLAANTDKLNDTFTRILQVWATNTLAKVEADTAKFLAGVISNFSDLIQQFPLGNKASNMELAITGYEIALTIYTRNDFPQDWATTQNNLGAAYRNRIRGDKADNLENAIAAYTASLEVLTRTAFPQQWATIQNNLGIAYSDRIRGDKADNLEMAIAAYTASLEVYTRTAFPQNWAMTQNNLGNAYFDRIRGDKADNLEMAIAAFTASLEVLVRTDFPQQWATTQNNLGNAYQVIEDKANNLEMVIPDFTASLEVYTRTAFPSNHATVLFNLGRLYQELQQFNLAESTFAAVIDTVEDLRLEIISDEESKRKLAEKRNKVYRKMAEVCLELGNEREAIEYIEYSKNRNLVELILERDSQTIFPPEVITELEQLRDEIASRQYNLQNGKTDNPNAAKHIQKLRQRRENLQSQYLPIGANFNLKSFQKTLDKNTAIIEWYITFNKIIAIVIKPLEEKITLWKSQPQELDALFNWINEYINDYYTVKEQWQEKLEVRLNQLSEILHLEDIIGDLHEQYKKLILIPHSYLHLFPLHALPVKGSYLIDLFPEGVSYAPSLRILQQIQLRQRNDFNSLFAIQTPTKDLYEKDLGAVAAIEKLFRVPFILKRSKAKKSSIINLEQNTNNIILPEELTNTNCLFFFCHGYFNINSPIDSGLLLADSIVFLEEIDKIPERHILVSKSEKKAIDLNKCLTLGDIIAHFKLDNCRLVTLAACETGLTNISSISDEYIGLPSGFLLAGSTNVVSSLWYVDATATALLMIKFYQELQHQSNITLALKAAQLWLRDITVNNFKKWVENSLLKQAVKIKLNNDFNNMEREHGINHQPFKSPFYWAAFCAIGKGD